MGRKGAKKHLKRLPAPKTFRIPRKQAKFTGRPAPGPHRLNECIPLFIVIRDLLRWANTGKEAKKIITAGKCKIDGRVIRNYRFPVGLMDILTIPSVDERFRILPYTGPPLVLHPISEEEANIKLTKIIRKTKVKGGEIQLNLHDGRNKLFLEEEFEALDLELCTIGSTLRLTVPEQQIQDLIPLESGVSALVTAGKNIGLQGRILELERKMGKGTAILQATQEKIFRTALEFIFVVGRNNPVISLPT
ncbi:MAG: 30S ribosomal protein S4e [Candidatus Heimdallarchaeota archaeon]